MRDFLDTAKLRVKGARDGVRRFLPTSPLAAGLAWGTPAAIVGVWLLNRFVLPEPMPDPVQVAAGSLITGVTGYCAQLFQLVLLKLRR
jgi:hypothetical protein